MHDDATPPTTRGALGSRRRRLRWPLGLVIVLAILGFFTVTGYQLTLPWRHDVGPLAPFRHHFARGSYEFWGPMLATSGSSVTLRSSWDAYGVLLAPNAQAPPTTGVPKHIVIMYDGSPDVGQPTIQVRVEPQGPSKGLPGFANPSIICNLGPEQSRYVLEYGLPQSLVDSLIAIADYSGWAPCPPGVAPSACVIVPAEEHFPSTLTSQRSSGNANGTTPN
jgi:hypothetical protein